MIEDAPPDEGRWLSGWLERVATIGVDEADAEDERVAKTTLTLITLLIIVLGSVWVVTYLVLGRVRSALIPLGYQLASGATLIVFARSKSFRFFRISQLAMMLALPFLLQWSLGGFTNSSAVALWAALTPALSRFVGERAWPWLGGFLALTAVSLVFDDALADSVAPLPAAVVTWFFGLNLGAVTLVVFAAGLYFVRERDRYRGALRDEQQRSERLLLNVLPRPIAERLKRGESPIADHLPAVTVLFADIVEFTPQSARLAPGEVVSFLSDLFADLDDLARRNGLTPIKTLGDGYMAVGGLFDPDHDHVASVLDTALVMRDEISDRPFGSRRLTFRIGIETGPAVAAVVGKGKFSYDLWGDSVNVASRMESHGIPGEVQVTARVRDLMRNRYAFRPRGAVDVKGLGEMEVYLLEGRRSAPG